MKRFILIATVVLSCAVVSMAGMDKVIAKISTSSMTSAVSCVDTTDRITGYINRIDFTFANSTNPVDSVVLTSSNVLSTIVTTYKTLTWVATNASYMFTNGVQCVFDESFYLTVTNAAPTNQSIQSVIFYERP